MDEKKVLSNKSTQPITSLLGKKLYVSIPDDEASIRSRQKMITMVEKSLSDIEKDPSNPVHYGSAGWNTWSLSDLHGSLEIFDKGTENCPENYELYWCKTLLKTSMRDLAGAIADAERAAVLIRGKLDHALDVRIFRQSSPHRYSPYTIHFMIWYHLGMAYYLNGDLEKAKQAYLECDKFIYANDALVSRSCWFYQVLRELGEYDQAAALMEEIDDDIKLLADPAYGDQSLLFKGTLTVAEVRAKIESDGRLNIIHEYAVIITPFLLIN